MRGASLTTAQGESVREHGQHENDVSHLIYGHELFCGILLSLIEGRELDVLRWAGLITERSSDRVEVVSANGNKLASTTDVLVQLVLKVDERVV